MSANGGLVDSNAEFIDIVTLAYEAALDPHGHGQLLGKLRTYLSADAVVWLSGNGAEPGRPSRISQSGLDPGKMGEYGRLGWSSPLAAGMLRASPCEPLTNRMLVAPGELERSDFYQQWIKPNNVEGTGMIGMLAPLTGPTVIISAMREKSAGRVQFDDDNAVALYRRLLPFLARAAGFANRMERVLDAAKASAAMSGNTLDIFRVATLCLDDRFRIVWMNKAAGSLLSRANGLKSAGATGLAADTWGETERLNLVLRQACLGNGGAVQLHRVSGEAALCVIAVPYRQGGRVAQQCGVRQTPSILAFVFDLDDSLDAPRWLVQRRLRSLYGLTTTEALICLQLAEGAGIPAVGLAMRLEPSTIRSHVKQIFAKTGVHSQVLLARLVARLEIVGD